MTVLRATIPEQVVESRRLGRHLAHDSRSWRYPAPMADEIKTVRHEYWGLPLDQGDLGSCTGNAMTGLLMTAPFYERTMRVTGGRPLDEDDAVHFYSRATHIDHYRGIYDPPRYHEDTGSNGLAVCKAAKEGKFLDGYAHCFSLEHFVRTLVLQPTITGALWKSGEDAPDRDGVVHFSGDVRGGHEFLQVGLVIVDAANLLNPLNMVECMQSWGAWGVDGIFRIPMPDFDAMRKAQGDVKTGILL